MRFVRVRALLTLALALLVGGAVLLGRQQPPSETILQLHLLECAPSCLNYMVALQESAVIGVQSLINEFNLPSDHLPRFLADPNSTSWAGTWGTRIQISPNDQLPSHIPIAFYFSFPTSPRDEATIEQILVGGDLGTSLNMPTIGEIVSIFGSPTCVYISPATSLGWFLIYEIPEGITQVNILSSTDQLSWEDKIYAISFQSYRAANGAYACHYDSSDYYPWSGLLSRQRYQQVPSFPSAFEQQ